MKTLLTVVKEAKNKIKSKFSVIHEVPCTDSQLEDIKKIVKATYLKQSFWWKVKNPFKIYKQVLMLSFQYNFIGGVII